MPVYFCRMNQYKFICKKCGVEVTIEAPELTDSQKEKLHECKKEK